MIEFIWNFLKENWGDFASSFGFFLTVLFSLQAKSAATAARKAADNAKSRLYHLDYYSETGRMIALSDELHNLLLSRKFERASDKASALRYGCHILANMKDVEISNELLGQVKRLPTQFRDIMNAIDKILDPNQSNPELARYRRIVANGRETLSLLEHELKKTIGDKNE